MAIWLYHFQLLFYPFRLFFSGYLSHDYSKSSKAEGFSLHTFFLVLDNEQNLEKKFGGGSIWIQDFCREPTILTTWPLPLPFNES